MKGYRATFKHYGFLTLADFERKNFQDFLASKSNKDWTRKTCEQRIAEVFVFGNWLCANHLVNQRFRVKRLRRPNIRPIPESYELELLFDSLHQDWKQSSHTKRFINHQRYLLLRVLYETGCRISEATGLYLEDIRINERRYFVFINGTKTETSKRTVEISPKLFSELNEFRNEYDLQGRLFSSSRGNAFNPEEYSKWLRLYAEKLGISCKIHPHLFRYLFIIESIKQGKDAIEVMTRLGHSDVSMTIYYFNQVRRLYPEANLSSSISILEKRKGLNRHIYGGKAKLYE